MNCRSFIAALAFAVSGQGAVITDSSTLFYEVLGADGQTPLCSSALGTCGAYESSVSFGFREGVEFSQANFDPESGRIVAEMGYGHEASNFLETNSVRFTLQRKVAFNGTYVVGAPGDPEQPVAYEYALSFGPDTHLNVIQYEYNFWNSLFPLDGNFAIFSPTPGVPFVVDFGVSVNEVFLLGPTGIGGAPNFDSTSDSIGIHTLFTDPPLNAREIPEPGTTGMFAAGLGVLGWFYAKRATRPSE